jgi:UDPglucose 6-dehydrogenase
MGNFKLSFPEDDLIHYHDNKYDALEDSDALIILTEWEEFIDADLSRMKNLMKLPIIIDGRNIYEPQNMQGFEYYGIGRNKFDVYEILK